jgi:hypothetical protein
VTVKRKSTYRLKARAVAYGETFVIDSDVKARSMGDLLENGLDSIKAPEQLEAFKRTHPNAMDDPDGVTELTISVTRVGS